MKLLLGPDGYVLEPKFFARSSGSSDVWIGDHHVGFYFSCGKAYVTVLDEDAQGGFEMRDWATSEAAGNYLADTAMKWSQAQAEAQH